uniref:C2H2-type domain-containing protein n=1 Tax=Athene cunicularia TaxID=194338 RepID=A0A663N3D3_ATHCN
MLQGPQEEPQSPTVAVEHDGQQQPRDTQGSRGTGEPRKCSFKGTYAEDPLEATTQPQSNSRQKEYKCEQCGKVFTSGSNLSHHRRTHTGKKPYKCQDCGMSFTRRGNLQRHQRTHTKEKPFPCPTCGKRFSCKSNIVTHHRIHTGERPFPCSHCGKRFRVKCVLRKHQESVHNGAGTEEQKEEQCQPREEQRGMLQGPQEEPQSPTVAVEHDGQQQPRDTQGSRGTGEPRKCSFKGTYAEDPQEDETETQSSSAEKLYRCEHCGKFFSTSSNRTRHQWTHSGEKPFQCQECGKSFTHRWKLRCHQSRHKEEKSYLCTTSGKRFSCCSNLLKHQFTHTRETPCDDSHCGKSFQQNYQPGKHQEVLPNGESSWRLNPIICYAQQ